MTLVDRFLKYVSFDTQSDESTGLTPSTPKQMIFAEYLKKELESLGLEDITLDEHGYLFATLPANINKEVPTIGFIAHMDTSPDMTGIDVTPRIVEKYDGSDIVLCAEENVVLSPSQFPELLDHKGEDLIVTNGKTLLGADDKAGIAEIVSAMVYLKEHPEIKHGKIMCAFGPDEEIGTGADHFDVKQFPVDFAYTIDGESLGQLEYETFNAAGGTVTLKGVSVHTGTAKGIMINCAKLAMQFDALLPGAAVPEHTCGRQGFFMLMNMETQVDTGKMNYIIRDHNKELFEAKKAFFLQAGQTLNEIYGREVCEVSVKDQYYNMYDIIKDNMECVNVAKAAMKKAGITPICDPIRGGTDGSKISFMGIPTPNIFTGVENLHGRHEFACIDDMKKAVEVIVNIVNIEK